MECLLIISHVDVGDVPNTPAHNHLDNNVEVEIKTIVNKIKTAAKKCNDGTRNVIVNQIGNLLDEASVNFPSISIITRSIQYIKANKLEDFSDLHDLKTLQIPHVYTVTFWRMTTIIEEILSSYLLLRQIYHF